jgi:NADPH:quinone reductase
MTKSMRAIGSDGYGPLQSLKPLLLPIPLPKAGELRIRVHCAAINPADYKVITGEVKFLHGRNSPLVVGYDFSGVVDMVGPGTGHISVGDSVFGFLPYGMKNKQGAFSEMVIAQAVEVAIKPTAVSHDVAAASATAALTALQAIRDVGKFVKGSVLITGVSGGVGSVGIGVARKLGASVTAVGSGSGLSLAKKLGATQVIDRKSSDVLDAAAGPFDVIFDSAAAYRWSQWKSRIKTGGAYVTTLPSASFFADKMVSLLSGSRAEFVIVKSRAQDLKLLGEWLTQGLEIPIDTKIPVREVAQGLVRLKAGEVLGRICVDVMGGF